MEYFKYETKQKIREKINARFAFINLSWGIVFILLTIIFFYTLTLLLTSNHLVSNSFYKKLSVLISSAIILLALFKLKKYIIRTIENKFITYIFSNEAGYNLISINGIQYNLKSFDDAILKKGANYAVSWFIYRSFIPWCEGQENAFKICLKNVTVQVIPSFFEETNQVYKFISHIPLIEE